MDYLLNVKTWLLGLVGSETWIIQVFVVVKKLVVKFPEETLLCCGDGRHVSDRRVLVHG